MFRKLQRLEKLDDMLGLMSGKMLDRTCWRIRASFVKTGEMLSWATSMSSVRSKRWRRVPSLTIEESSR